MAIAEPEDAVMHLVRYETAEDFERVVAPALIAREAEHNLMLGLVSILKTDSRFYGDTPYLATVVDGGRVVVAGLMTPPHPVVVSLCHDVPSLQILAEDVRAFLPSMPGVNAPSPTARLFAGAWQEVTGDRTERRLAERIYRLERLVGPAGVDGRARQITLADTELLTRWSVAFEAETMQGSRTLEAGRKDIEQRLASDPTQRGMFVWEAGGKTVCMAGYGGPTPNSLRIGPVYTPPEHRRHGYAAACTAAACDWILGPAGKSFVTLFADIANPTSNGVYQRLGFEAVCDAEAWRFT
jgi:uncharacterized protein